MSVAENKDVCRIEFALAKVQFGDLVDRAEGGETIEIMRNGRPAARLTPPHAAKTKIDGELLLRAASKLPWQHVDAATFLRRMRDNAWDLAPDAELLPIKPTAPGRS